MLTGVLRQARRRAAVNAYLEAGWPIAPGAWWDSRAEQYRCRRVGCLTRGTIHAADGMTPAADPSAWSSDPATVLLVTGHGIDVVELPLGSTPPEAHSSPVPRCPAPSPSGRRCGPDCSCSPAPGAQPASPTSFRPDCPKACCCTARAPTSRSRRPGYAPATSVWMRPPQSLDWHLPELGEVVDLLTRRLLGEGAAEPDRRASGAAAAPFRGPDLATARARRGVAPHRAGRPELPTPSGHPPRAPVRPPPAAIAPTASS